MIDPVAEWERLLSSISRLQEIIPEAVLVGGSASAIFAEHRFSTDHDHVITNLKEKFDEILMDLESVSGWKTARLNRPVQILGSLDGIETGIRQLKRTHPLETELVKINNVSIKLPSLAETLRIKVFLALERNATRDYLDIAALYQKIGKDKAYEAIKVMDSLYPQKNGDEWAVRSQMIKQLSEPTPYDLDDLDLSQYKGIRHPYNNWDNVKEIISDFSSFMLSKYQSDLNFKNNQEFKTTEENINNWLKSNNKSINKLPGLK